MTGPVYPAVAYQSSVVPKLITGKKLEWLPWNAKRQIKVSTSYPEIPWGFTFDRFNQDEDNITPRRLLVFTLQSFLELFWFKHYASPPGYGVSRSCLLSSLAVCSAHIPWKYTLVGFMLSIHENNTGGGLLDKPSLFALIREADGEWNCRKWRQP